MNKQRIKEYIKKLAPIAGIIGGAVAAGYAYKHFHNQEHQNNNQQPKSDNKNTIPTIKSNQDNSNKSKEQKSTQTTNNATIKQPSHSETEKSKENTSKLSQTKTQDSGKSAPTIHTTGNATTGTINANTSSPAPSTKGKPNISSNNNTSGSKNSGGLLTIAGKKLKKTKETGEVLKGQKSINNNTLKFNLQLPHLRDSKGLEKDLYNQIFKPKFEK